MASSSNSVLSAGVRPPKKGFAWGNFIMFTILVVTALMMIAPFIWQTLTSFKTVLDTERGIWPTVWIFDNYPKVFEQINFARYYFNSILVALWVTTLQVSTSALAAYAFSRLRWPGRDKVFMLYLATMMIPGVVLMIPNFWLMLKLNLYNSYWGLIIPAAFSAFGTFLLRQFMLTIPSSLDEAATIDGASEWRVFTDIILPLAQPGLVVLAIFTFLGNYMSFFWPLILIKDDALRTLPVGLLYFDGAYEKQTNMLMAGSIMSILPLIVLFIIMQKQLVKGIQMGAIKG